MLVVNVATPEAFTVPEPISVPAAPQGLAGPSGVIFNWRPAVAVGPANPDALPMPTPGALIALVRSQKMTAPNGVPVGVGATVAVNVTDWPTVAGLSEVLITVVVTVSGRTVSIRMLDVEVAKPAFPKYVAVMLSDPTGRLEIANPATPDEFIGDDPSNCEFEKKSIVPSGDPVGIGVTVAVNVTTVPTVTVLCDDINPVAVTVSAETASVSMLEVEVA